MKNKWVVVFVVLVVFGFAFFGCDNGNDSETKEASYDLTMDGFTASIRGTVLTITLSDPPDSALMDPSTVSGVSGVTSGLKLLSGYPSDSNFELVYMKKDNEERYGVIYANQNGSFTQKDTTVTFSEGKGWYVGGEQKQMTAANNYSPYSSTHYWIVRYKTGNKDIVWQQ
jgi:hypothetical protein